MVAQPALKQAVFHAGEIMPALESSTHLKAWFQALRRMKNYEPVPQGGFRLMPRSKRLSRCRTGIEQVVMATHDPDFGPHAAAATVRIWDTFSGDAAISLVKIGSFSADEDAEMLVQYHDAADGVWKDMAPAFVWDSEERARVAARPPNAAVTVTGMRIRVQGQTDPVTVTLSGVTFWTETGELVSTVLRPFIFDPDESYIFATQPGLVDIFRNGVFVGAVDTNFSDNQLRRIKVAQQFDTMLAFHQNIESARIERRGADHEWQFDAIPWDAIAEVDLGGTYAKTTDVWQVYLRWAGDFRDSFVNYRVNGEETGAVEWPVGMATADYVDLVVTALEALPSLGSGIVGSVIDDDFDSSGSAAILQFAFGGDNDGVAYDLQVSLVNISGSAASALSGHITIGKTAGEPIMSSGRGWPAAGSFTPDDRLAIGGFRSKPAAVSISRTAEYFDHNIKAAKTAEAPVVFNTGTEGAETIRRLFSAAHLLAFTSKGIYFVPNRAIDATQPVTFTSTSRVPAHPDADVFEIDGDLYYLTADGALLMAGHFDEVNSKYIFQPVSILAAHLLADDPERVASPARSRETTFQKASARTNASRLFIGRTDGRLPIAHILQNQEILGFAEWATAGEVKSLAVDGLNRVHLVIEREVDGETVAFLEWLQDGLLFDCAITQTFGPATKNITGLDDHEGADVWAVADGFVLGPFEVASGAIHLDVAASVVTVGRWTPPIAETLPLILELADGRVLYRPGRIHTVDVSIIDTDSIAIGANGEDPRDVELYRFGMPADAPPPKVTGRIRSEGIPGFSDMPTAVITQVRPGHITVRDLALEAKL